MLRVLSFLFVLFSTTTAYANCDFKTGRYATELKDPSYIKKIEVVVPKSGKFAKNGLEILQSGGANILPHLRKKFKAKVLISYPFGHCTFDATVRQNGDFKDHIKFIKGQIIRSLDVKLKTGNVLNAVAFKLLIPETRGSENEILTTLLLKEMNFIAPKTFSVLATVNGVETPMLFQEKSRKESLERNLRREGPLFEGDEHLLWSNNFKSIAFREKMKISLSNVENTNWFEKGVSSQSITLKAYAQLQNTYTRKEFDPFNNHYVINPNQLQDAIFDEYLFLLLALGGKHALPLSNRKYYYNSITEAFEPVYYDGNVNITAPKVAKYEKLVKWHLENSLRVGVDQKFINKIIKTVDDPQLKEQFVEHASKFNIDAKEFYDNFTKSLVSNVHALKKYIPIRLQEEKNTASVLGGVNSFIELAKNNVIPHKFITDIQFSNGDFIASFESGDKKILTVQDVAKVISENELFGHRTVFVGNYTVLDSSQTSINRFADFPGILTTANGMKVSVSKRDKLLTLTQTNQDDWALVKSAHLAGWTVSFVGVEKNDDSHLLTDQRFNKFGLTGCLTIYNSNLESSNISVSGGVCEDSLNIVNSDGLIDTVLVSGAFADAFDIDFSTISIQRVNIDNAGNDCLDVSGGHYEIDLIDLLNCDDKGISVGEGSTLSAKKVYLSGANIGVASKDLSKVEILDAKFENDTVCIEVMQKKQEFGGAVLQVGNLECDGIIKVDKHSEFKVGLQ